MDHEAVAAHLQGPLTFVGAAPQFQAFAVSRLEDQASDAVAVNVRCHRAEIFMQLPVRGTVVCVATDRDGMPIDVSVDLMDELWLPRPSF